MVVMYPFFKDRLVVPGGLFIFAVIVVGLAAGLTNPRQQWVMILDVFVSVLAFAVFEYYALAIVFAFDDLLFWVNQVLAAVFFAAFYFSIKTVRGSLPQA